jgi:hypothetical protein
LKIQLKGASNKKLVQKKKKKKKSVVSIQWKSHLGIWEKTTIPTFFSFNLVWKILQALNKAKNAIYLKSYHMWNSEHCMKSIVSRTFTNCPTDLFSSLKLYIFLASHTFTIIALVQVYNSRVKHSIPLLLSSLWQNQTND